MGTKERRTSERRTPPGERRTDAVRAVAGERRAADQRGEAKAMVDALEDILRWEKASERTLKVATKVIGSNKPAN
ncbi:MAG: hypothetical protein KIT84_12485 [Labilithrix sp.]|nr:hypothetical protein [Labilithrix sp.]MCW5811831.1 hypothetical protein [Labilithrix sp.]